jgi:tRNA-uridine 2-sulfurtransferase
MNDGRKKIKVFVAMSGGVDSSVAALLLKRKGYEVTGVYMKNWSDPLADECPWRDDIRDFYAVCKQIGILARLEIFEEEYRRKVVQYLINGYKRGLTPNPDMLCNREIKFKLFLHKARQMGADMIATGHYVIKKANKNIYQLWCAKDTNKDQSYFLSLLNQKQLKDSLFPIGHYTKPQVRLIAKRAGLSVHDKKDSQGICFIGKVKFRDFLKQFIKSKSGPIITTDKKIIGRHQGYALYTIGQRHGLGIGGGKPFFIVKKIKNSNTLIVTQQNKSGDLFDSQITIKKCSWISGLPPLFPLSCQARIRYRQPLQKCLIYLKKKQLFVVFAKPQRAVTPGQFIVFYKNKLMLGGGTIL